MRNPDNGGGELKDDPPFRDDPDDLDGLLGDLDDGSPLDPFGFEIDDFDDDFDNDSDWDPDDAF